jgi:hypothetical protein
VRIQNKTRKRPEKFRKQTRNFFFFCALANKAAVNSGDLITGNVARNQNVIKKKKYSWGG